MDGWARVKWWICIYGLNYILRENEGMGGVAFVTFYNLTAVGNGESCICQTGPPFHFVYMYIWNATNGWMNELAWC